ncbi:hypothetical protein [Bowmanella denitrificans]|uniref:hypothetical protein n=1 Tax=Bowmanella denitrificans TaxID=366582 RepID=UPI000C9C7AF8|nr:hypothetical protein [Bowmanella denitrificans]
MSLNLYMKTDKFKTNKEMADYFYGEFSKRGFKPGSPENEDYMYAIESVIDGEAVTFYLGKNDEASIPPLWQIWPEQKVSFLKRLFGKPDRAPEEKAKRVLEEIVKEIEGVQAVEWAI